MLTQPISGAQCFLDGFKLIFKPGLRRYVFIPLMINIILFSAMFLVSKHYMAEFNVWIENHIPHWLNWIGSILWLVFFIGFFLVMIYTFVTIANLISAPFNSLLAEKVEFYLTGNKLESRSFLAVCKDIPSIIGRQFSIIGYYLPRAVLLLILFFIPVVQIIAAALWFVFNAWFMTLQYVDYPTDNHHVSMRDVHTWMKARRGASLSFGSFVLIASMIPVVNFFVVPAAVAGATKFFIKNSSL